MRPVQFAVAIALAALYFGGATQAQDAKAATKPSEENTPLYTVVDGYKVDPDTLTGFRTWRAAACDRCHGANQEGMVGPSLIESLKVISKEEFIAVIRDGRLEKGMQSFGNDPRVMDNIDQLYAYLKGRSDGAITRARVSAIE
ncbi:MAG: c-type cytochrome [Rhodocyclaceae bacterium]